MRRCNKCVLRDNSPGVLLYDEGVCNVCTVWDGLSAQLTDYPRLQTIFGSKLDDVRGRYTYDAVVGLSGGKDGAYLVYVLKEIYGLKVLAITFDFGFMPNAFAKENAKRVTTKMGVDHEVLSLPPDLVRRVFRAYLAKPTATTPCHLCTSVLGASLGLNLALERRIPKIVTGLDRGQLLNKLHLSHARKRVLENIEPHNREVARKRLKKAISRLSLYFRWLGLSAQDRELLLPPMSALKESIEVPEIMMYFLYHPHDEEAMKRLLENEVDWVRPKGDARRGHYDCEFKTLAGGAANRLGLGERLEYELSVDIREGVISREEALARLAHEQQEVAGTVRPFQAVENWLGLSEKDFEQKVARLSRIAPYYSRVSNALLKRFGSDSKFEKILFLVRPH